MASDSSYLAFPKPLQNFLRSFDAQEIRARPFVLQELLGLGKSVKGSCETAANKGDIASADIDALLGNDILEM